MRTRSLTALSATAALTLFITAACSDDEPAADSGTDPADTAEPADPSDEGGAPSGDPIVVGSTLSLTGAFGPTGIIHQIAGEQFVEQLNENGGLLGRPVEWMVLDDESDQAQVTALYERLIGQEGVDLIIGPYATPNIISAMAVAERHGFTMPQHTAVLAPLMTYECQFPAWSIGPEPNAYVPEQVFDALDSLPTPPERVAFVINQGGSTDFIAQGSPDDDSDAGAVPIAEERGYEVVAEIRYPPDTTDWAPIAAQIRDADPDFVFNSGLAVDPVNLLQAMEQLDYRPPLMFSLFPAPGPLLGLGDVADGLLSVSIFEPNDALIQAAGPEAQAIVDEFETRAAAEGLPYTAFETQATASWNAWEILVAAVEGAGDTDQQAMCDYLHENGADTTFSGHLEFNPDDNNFWPSTQGLKQIQDGDWVMVWPADRAAAQLQPPVG
ncbi:amino acid ABC transporter substrate-binding protein [Jiangella mangrovi]|uniref:Branched-chain amino acid transport system substrate-binding protein n=1 Tax=Jiangella mangrovi TaxID=1524084 RepID=A0A7W9GUU3_9ACTN|nr:amino acid ABC transporter substrate-binding protein [Jiangella mangrovi]MBB5790472.1 branched-chain amino acid transport system substrate-binding protein [Jiangella mangrovi]